MSARLAMKEDTVTSAPTMVGHTYMRVLYLYLHEGTDML